AEFATMIVKTLGLSSSGTKLFADTQGHWGRYTIAAAYEAGIVSGYDFNRFGPDDPITREQMAVMIVKAAGLSNQNSHLGFVDSRAISTWARSAVARAAAQKMIMGYPDNTFRPANPATRAEAVSIFARAPF
ncbi:MAG: S-layer homology domain-containing protein, partial [Bacillota bacterium]|nr:S-layer homology domain-containing protein [Bacillota bacterium]